MRQTDVQQLWWLAYPAVKDNPTDVSVLETSQHGLNRNQVAIGSVVGVAVHEHRQRSGKAIRLRSTRRS